MKKFILLLLSFLMLFVFSGCAATVSELTFDAQKPWQAYENSNSREEIRYRIERRYHKPGQQNTILVASGALSYRIEHFIQSDVTTLTMQYFLTYEDVEEAGANKGLTDRIESTVRFKSKSMEPLYSQKELTFAERQPAAGEVFLNPGYTATTDYEADKPETVLQYHAGEIIETKSLKSGNYYDNEQLYYLIRAFTGLRQGASTGFQLYNAYDRFLSQKFATHKMKAEVASSLMQVVVPETIYELAVARESEKDPGKTKSPDGFDGFVHRIDALYTSVKLDKKKSGPPTSMYFSDLPFSVDGSVTKKVLLKMEQREYSTANSLTYTTDYAITSYNVV